MFALVVCVFSATTQIANDPVIAVQAKYPVRRVAITTNHGTTIHYQIPLDAPPALWRAVKVVELAERDLLISEGLHQFKLEIVQNERKLEALRTNFLAAGLLPVPGNGFGNVGFGSRAGFYYCQLPCMPESTLRGFLATNLAAEASTERVLISIDNLLEAQFRLHRVWVDLAFPGKGFGKGPAPAGEPVKKELINAAAPNAPARQENIKAMSFDEACKLANELAIEDEEARKRVLAVTAKRDELTKRFTRARTGDKTRILTELETVNREYLTVLSESRGVRRRWEEASNRVLELTPRPPK